MKYMIEIRKKERIEKDRNRKKEIRRDKKKRKTEIQKERMKLKQIEIRTKEKKERNWDK